MHRLVSEYATDENEVKLAYDETDKMRLTLLTLGRSVVCVVDKQRRTFIRGEVKVTLDEVKVLGHFIEVEIEGEESAADINRLQVAVAELGLNHALHINAGYPELIMSRKK